MSKITRDWIVVSAAFILLIVALNGAIIWHSFNLQAERYAQKPTAVADEPGGVQPPVTTRVSPKSDR